MAVLCAQEIAANDSVETLIFVDVDGVLNVAVDGPGGNPVLLDRRNLHQALEIVKLGPEAPDHALAERIVSAYKRAPRGYDVGATYGESIADSNTEFSNLLVARLAEIIRTCGGRRKVVLSSNWRMFKYAKKLRELERTLSEKLGEKFTFDARTALTRESVPADRLRNIGNFIAAHCAPRAGPAPSVLGVLVLDDFGASAASALNLSGHNMGSTADAERLLRDRAPASVDISVSVVHTYDEWTTPSGLPVCIGAGLTKKHLAQACAFLGGDARAFLGGELSDCEPRGSGEQDGAAGMRAYTSSESLSTMPGLQTSTSSGTMSSAEDLSEACL